MGKVGDVYNTASKEKNRPWWKKIGRKWRNTVDEFSGKARDERQLKLAEYQFQMEQEMIEKQNEYNKPINQMARYAEAGLNPNLVYSQGSPGDQSSHASYSAPELQSSGSATALPRMLQLAGGISQIAKTVADTKRIMVDAQSKSEVLPYLGRKHKLANQYLSRRSYGQLQQNMLLGDTMTSKVTAASAEAARKQEDALYAKYRAYFQSLGISSGDHPVVRGLMSLLLNLGINPTEVPQQLLDYLGTKP